MTPKRPCPHCSREPLESGGRDFGWLCHHRAVNTTPTRESARYRWGRLPDHSERGLYVEGPDDSVTMWELTVSQLSGEAIAPDDGFADRLRGWQSLDGRRNFVRWLAIHRDMWGYVKLAIRLHSGDAEKVKEFTGWLESASRIRDRQVAESKEVARRLATV